MGQDNTVPRRINRVEGAAGQIIKSGGPGVAEYWGLVDYGLAFEGIVSSIAGAPAFNCDNLLGFGTDFFEGYWAYVLWDAGGLGGAPQGEFLECTGYDTGSGLLTVAAYTVGIAVGDHVLLINPIIMGIVPGADAATNVQMRDVIGNKTDTALQVATAADSLMRYIKGLLLGQSRQLFSMDFWSDMQEEVVVTGAQTTPGLPSVTVANLPDGATIVRAIAMFKFRMIENTHAGVNKLDAAAALPIQVNRAAWLTAIDFVDDAFTLSDTAREGGDVIFGDNNVVVQVDRNSAYTFQWLNAKADQNNILFNDVQIGLRIWYSV